MIKTRTQIHFFHYTLHRKCNAHFHYPLPLQESNFKKCQLFISQLQLRNGFGVSLIPNTFAMVMDESSNYFLPLNNGNDFKL